MIRTGNEKLGNKTPVSYTHLDVYKRQASRCGTIASAGIMTGITTVIAPLLSAIHTAKPGKAGESLTQQACTHLSLIHISNAPKLL